MPRHQKETTGSSRVQQEREIRDVPCCVVGGAGFLGSTLVDYLLQERDCRVLVIDNLCVGKEKHIHNDAEFVHHDITTSEEFMCRVFTKLKIQYVFNYAAWPYVPDSFSRPLQVFNVNAMGAIKVINAAHEAGCAGILQVSSAELYGAGQSGTSEEKAMGGFKLTESAAVVPRSSYGASKAAVDYYCQAAWKEREVPVITLRQFNCVGPRETHPYVVPEIIDQIYSTAEAMRKFDDSDYANGENPEKEILRSGSPVIQLGNNTARDFLYSGDAVRMAVELLEKGEFGEVYNMGSQVSISIYSLAELIGRVLGWDNIEIVKEESRVRPWEIWHLQSDNTKLYGVISARPEFTLIDAIQLTVDYYRNNGSKWDW